MKNKLSLVMAGILLTMGVVNTTYASETTMVSEPSNVIIYDGEITYYQTKEIIVENLLYAYDLAKHHQSIQEAEDIYDKYSFAELEKSIKVVEDRLNSITGPENQLQIIECLNMHMDLTRSISTLIVKEA